MHNQMIVFRSAMTRQGDMMQSKIEICGKHNLKTFRQRLLGCAGTIAAGAIGLSQTLANTADAFAMVAQVVTL